MSLTQIDPVKILSYGIIGFGFLLALLSFWLLRSVLRGKQVPRTPAYWFMAFSIVLVCLGLASERLRLPPPVTKKWQEMLGAPIPCSAQPYWPRGQWYLWGRFENHTPTKENTDNFTRIPQVFPWAVFTSDHAFWSETEELAEAQPKTGPQPNPFDRIYNAKPETDGEKLVPGQTVVFVGWDNTRGGVDHTPYHMRETLKVSEDGCMIEGHWEDNRKNKGDEHYLYPSERYYVPLKKAAVVPARPGSPTE